MLAHESPESADRALILLTVDSLYNFNDFVSVWGAPGGIPTQGSGVVINPDASRVAS